MKADVNISLSLLKMYVNTFWLTAIIGIKISAPGEARTHGLQIMRLTRCLLRYGGLVFGPVFRAKISICKYNGDKNFVPTGGLEPPIFGLGDRRLIH